jgi:hypothetical protein
LREMWVRQKGPPAGCCGGGCAAASEAEAEARTRTDPARLALRLGCWENRAGHRAGAREGAAHAGAAGKRVAAALLVDVPTKASTHGTDVWQPLRTRA